LNASHLARHVVHAAVPNAHHAQSNHPSRLTPAEEIGVQYAMFTQGFNNVLDFYVQAINQQSTNRVTVQTTVSAPGYTFLSPTIQVADASVFGPAGTYSKAVKVTSSLGTVPFGTFQIIGSFGNSLIIDPSFPPLSSLPTGTLLTANVPAVAQTSAAAIFPSYIVNSTDQLAITLVKYFNHVPVKLPAKNTPPHTPVQSGAIQSYVYQNIAGAMATSLQQLLLAIPLPTTPGADLQIYQDAVNSAIGESHLMLLNGVMQIFSRNLLINAQAPANRLGVIFNTGTSSGTGSTSGTSATPA